MIYRIISLWRRLWRGRYHPIIGMDLCQFDRKPVHIGPLGPEPEIDWNLIGLHIGERSKGGVL
jgi:hypothetical protein